MPIRTGEEFLESLKDGRQVWLRGERVDDVTTHIHLAGFAAALAKVYDLQHDPSNQDQLTIKSPTSGHLVSSAYQLPHTTEDLVRRRQLVEFWARRIGAVATRLPELQATMNIGLFDVRDILAEEDPMFAENVLSWVEYCREKDLCVTHAFTDPSRDQGRPPTDFEFLKVVERKPSGIVISGAKAIATMAPFANEFLGFTLPRPGITPEEIIYFAVPINTKGVHVICRNPLVPHFPEDYPLSPDWDEMDASVVFDEVFVPVERVFYLRRAHPDNLAFYGHLFAKIVNLAFFHVIVRATVKAEILMGICAAMVDFLGTAKQPHIQLALSEIITHVESLRALIYKAENTPIRSPSGLAIPNPIQMTICHFLSMRYQPQILQLIRELSGSGILMSPGQAEMSHAEIGPLIHRYFVGKDERAPERFRLLKLAWEYACDSFGSRQLLFEIFNAGGPTLNTMRLMSEYDLTPFMDLAKALAGVSPAPQSRDN